jgi:pimeloyl-ACP methyl ester carboxylesterase
MTIELVDSWVAVPGGQVFVRRWTAHQDRAPVVLLHDRLGFGRSTRRAETPTLDFIREEADTFFPAVTHALGVRTSLLFGHSVGGAMALVIAALHPGACAAVITEAAQAFVEPRTIAGIRAAKQAFGDDEQFARIAKWHGEKARWVLDAWTEVWLSPDFRSWSLDPYLGQGSVSRSRHSW